MSEKHRILTPTRLLALASSGGVLLAAALFSRFPQWVESFYAWGLGDWLTLRMSRLSGWTAVSLAEWLLAAATLWLLAHGAIGLWKILTGRTGWRRGIASGLARLFSAAMLLSALFYLLWGLNYSRPPLVDRMGWAEYAGMARGERAVEELRRLCLQLVEEANRAYQLSGGSAPDRQTVDESLERAYARLAQEMPLPPSWRHPRGPAKPLAASLASSHLGISGLYFPWTGEANYNSMVPDYQLPHTIAHEKAHQRGIAGEDEAHFFGYLACLRSSLPYARYSGLVFAQRTLLAELHRRDQEAAMELVAKRLPGVQRDISRAAAFWRSFQGPAADVGAAVNDSYLRLHGVPGGIDSYRLASKLLIVYSRVNGGNLGQGTPAEHAD